MQDLLQPQNNDLQIREGEDGVFVAGVHEVEVKNMEDCLHLLQIGDRNRCAFCASLEKFLVMLERTTGLDSPLHPEGPSN